MESLSILIVEDEPIIALDMKSRLTRMGYDVIGLLSNGEEVLPFLKEHRPHLILMDIHIEGPIDGIETAQMVNSQYSIPIIFLTAYSDEETVTRATETTSHGYLLKPFNNQSVRINIERALYRHKMDSELKDKEHLLSTTLDSLAEGVVVIHQNGTIYRANIAAREMMGILGPQDLPKGHYDQYFDLHLQGENLELMAKSNKLRGRLYTCHEDPVAIPIECTIGVFNQEAANIIGIVLAFRDITDQLAYEKAILEAKEKAEDHSRMKSEFLTNMTHELRTPLNSIIGMNQLVKDKVTDPHLKDYLGVSIQSAQFLLTMISDLLDFSKIEAGKMEVAQFPFNLGEEVENALERLAVQASKKKIRLLLDMPSMSYRNYSGDSVKISQIIFNLVGNGIKFTESGYALLECLLSDQSKSVQFRVKDTGIGMTQEHINQIFKDFYQIDGTQTRAYGGTGLGLSITKKLVEMMGGSIKVESTPGQGSTFVVTLPLGRPTKGPQHTPMLKGYRFDIRLAGEKETQILRNILEKEGARPEGEDRVLYFLEGHQIPQDLQKTFSETPENFFLINDIHREENPLGLEGVHWVTYPITRTKIRTAMGLDRKHQEQLQQLALGLTHQEVALFAPPAIRTLLKPVLAQMAPLLLKEESREEDFSGISIYLKDLKSEEDIEAFIQSHKEEPKSWHLVIHNTSPSPSLIRAGREKGIRAFIKKENLAKRLIPVLLQLLSPQRRETAFLPEEQNSSISQEIMEDLKKKLVTWLDLQEREEWKALEEELTRYRSKLDSADYPDLSRLLLKTNLALRGNKQEKIKENLKLMEQILNN